MVYKFLCALHLLNLYIMVLSAPISLINEKKLIDNTSNDDQTASASNLATVFQVSK